MKPVFEITADNANVTRAIRERFVSLNITDAAGFESDQLTLVLEDSPDPVTGAQIDLPRKGVIMEVALGYEIAGQSMVLPAGRWVVDEVEPSGGMGGQLLTITANGSDTASSMKEKKTRSWQDISLGDVLASIGRDNNLKTKVTDRFKSILFDQLDQTGESDINFIERLARDHDALGKVVGDILVFSQRNSGINASGQPLKIVSLGFPGNVSSWRMSAPGRQKFAQVSASWYDMRESAHKIVTAGSGQPVQYLEKVYPSEATAREAAQSKLKASQRGDSVLTLTGMVPPGSLMLVETPLNITGLRKGVDGRWRVNQVSLSMTTGGFTYSVQAVRPE